MSIKVEDLPDVTGQTLEDAKITLKPHGINAVRPTSIDGKTIAGTADMRSDRLNVAVKDGVISSVGRIG